MRALWRRLRRGRGDQLVDAARLDACRLRLTTSGTRRTTGKVLVDVSLLDLLHMIEGADGTLRDDLVATTTIEWWQVR